MLKYVGILLTLDQAAVLASKLNGHDFTDTSNEKNLMTILIVIIGRLERTLPDCHLEIVAVPRNSIRDEDQRFLIVCHAYNNPHESMDSYGEIPATKRDARMLAWLQQNGMDVQTMLNQWVTWPNPTVDSK